MKAVVNRGKEEPGENILNSFFKAFTYWLEKK